MAIPPRRDSGQDTATNEDVFFLPWSDGRSANSLAKSDKGKIATRRNDPEDDLVTICATHAIGIELGVTHSSISYLNEHGEPVTIPSRDGELSIPSVVDFHGDRIVVGTEALRNSVKYPGKVVVHAKGYMGDPSHRWKINGKSYSPVDISSLILKSMLDSSPERIGAINQAVITVPARCSDVQRQATVEAGKRAGLTRVDVVEEPVAASLCFVLGTEGIWFTDLATAQTIMVVNLADDTFDVSIVRYQKNEVRVIASASDPHLGELDWNRSLEVAVAKQFQKSFGIDPLKDRMTARVLALEAEHAKRELSVQSTAELFCSAGGERKSYRVDLDQFESLTQTLVDQIETVTTNLLRWNNLGWDKIDVVLTLGGASRLPMVRNLFKRLSGRTLNTSLSPDQLIAHGAAYYAGMLLKNIALSVKNPVRAQYEAAQLPVSNRPLVETEEPQSRSRSASNVSGNAGSAVVRKKYLTLDEAAAHLGITNDEMIRLREVGAVRGFSDRGMWRFKTSDIESYRQRMPPQSTLNTRERLEEFAFPAVPRDVQRDRRLDVDDSLSSGEVNRSPLTDQQTRATRPATRPVEIAPSAGQGSTEWDAVVHSHTTADAWSLVPISKLAHLEGVQARFQLTLPDCQRLLQSADRLGFALEPDARITGTCYEWYELVSVFPHDDALESEPASYRAASTLLRLGITVALADGEVDQAEMSRLFSHLKSQFTLSEHDAVRLDHLRYLLTKTRQLDPKLASRLYKQLDVAERSELGKFLISIAAADGEVSIHERSVLDAIYRDLGIPHLMAPHLAEISPTKPSLPQAVQLATVNQAPILQPGATNEATAVTPAKSAPVTSVIPPSDMPSASYDWLAHVAKGFVAPGPPTTKTSHAPFDHERIRRIEEEREKLSRSLSDVAETGDALVEIRPSSIPTSPHEPIPPKSPSLPHVQSEPVTPFKQLVIAPPVTSQQAHSFVVPAVPVVAPQPPRHRFDLDRIQRIEIDTAKVADFLRDAFRDEDDSNQTLPSDPESQASEMAVEIEPEELLTTGLVQLDVIAPAEEACSPSWSGLAPRFTPFVDRIARQPTWTRGELDKLARELGLMLGGAIDNINEWADEHLGDLLLIEVGDSFLVQGELLIDVSRTT